MLIFFSNNLMDAAHETIEMRNDFCLLRGIGLTNIFFFYLNLSWFGLANDHEHFLQESGDANFSINSLLHFASFSGIHFCFGRTTIINFCKL